MDTNEQLVIRIKAGAESTENMLQLWMNMEKLISVIAKEFKGYAEIDDLKQEGFLALYDAINHYDEKQGVPFSSYAVYWIKKKMKKYIYEKTKTIRIPEYAENERQKYLKYISEYKKEYGKKPARAQICHFLSIDDETLVMIEKNVNIAKISSLDVQLETEDSNGIAVIETIPGEDDENSIIKQIENNMLAGEIWKIVEELPEKEKKIVVCRYKQELEKREIAQKLKICEEDITKIHTRAFRRLRKSNRMRECYNDYIEASAYHHVGIASYNTTWNSITERVALRL